ncbi:MAG: hypothetical protein HYY22_03110 [Thaumarchaeota archaeon]|nr:hypothetical protein [Nitrososphaerota archaeon]
MSVTVTERKIDEKRRVTLPLNVSLKEGASVVMIASQDAAIITSNKHIVKKLAKILRELETSRKTVTLTEWEKMINEAGLGGLTSESIDRAVAESISRPKRPYVRKATAATKTGSD